MTNPIPYQRQGSPNSRRVRMFLAERSRQRASDFYSDLETRLGETSFVAGESFSAADITALIAVDFATNALKMGAPRESNNPRRWCEVVSTRPSAAA